jgi:aspartate-semialdehyde dehydrogenase
MYKENLAKMIYENMKMVLESEKSNQEFISITQKDIITYFTYQLKVTEDFLAYNVIPLISKMAQNDESLLEEKENSGDSLILSWKLNTNK